MNVETKLALFDICNKYDDVFIVDMFNYIFKYYFANKGLSVVRSGEEIPTGHFFGITRQLLFLKEKFPNCAIIFAVDGYDSTRREINEDYKANRVHEVEPKDYVGDILKCCSLIDGVFSCYDPHYEADDVIGSIANTVKSLCEKNSINKRVYILSSDRDMYQLITDDGYCKIRSIKKFGYGKDWVDGTEFIDEDKVKEAFNDVAPKDLLKFRAIIGDSSDNLKGYFRFRKANASIIATNFDYVPEEHTLKLKSGVPMRESWKKPLDTILSDFSVFEKNYAIMGLKSFDFNIVSDYKGLSDNVVIDVIKLLEFYELNMYLSSVALYSPYKDIISEYSTKIDDIGDAVDVITEDLSSLL